MIFKINIRSFWIFTSFFLLTIGNSAYLESKNLGNVTMYFGYAVLLSFLGFNFAKYVKGERKVYLLFLFVVVLTLFSIGILRQDLVLGTKIRLILTMVVLSSVGLLSEYFFISIDEVRKASYAIFYAIICATLLSILFKLSLVTMAVEGFGSWGINGGLSHKNYFAADMVVSFAGIYLYHLKFGSRTLDRIVMLIQLFLILLSNSRGGYIIFISFIAVTILFNVKTVSKIQKVLLGGIISLGIIFMMYVIYSKVVLSSGSYSIRIQGLKNYWNMFSGDSFHLWNGNAEMAFRDPTKTYEDNVRSITGWNGTTELSILSVLIKNGLYGCIGYMLIFLEKVRGFFFTKDSFCKLIFITSFVPLLISGLLENYIVNIQIVFGIFCYVTMTSAYSMSIENSKEDK